MSRRFKTILQLRDKIFSEWETGIVKGAYCGFNNFYQYYSMKPKGTTYVYGHPFAGKTQAWFEVTLNLTEMLGHNHVIFSPETGSSDRVSIKLISMFLRKSFYKGFHNSATEQEIDKAITHLSQHIFVAGDDEDFESCEHFYDYCDQISTDNNVHLHQTIIDPYNELEANFGGEARDIYTGRQLKYVRNNAIKKNRHNTIITHCKEIPSSKGKDAFGNDFYYYPAPTPQQILNGQEFHRKGMMMVAVWRPPTALTDQNGNNYAENETMMIVQKYKDEHTGSLGRASLFYDKNKHRYYESAGGKDRFAGKRTEQVSDDTSFIF